MQFYIFINSCALDEKFNKQSCFLNFLNKWIEVTQEFYFGLKKHKKTLLMSELDNDDKSVIDLRKYFDKSVEFIVIEEQKFSDISVLVCELTAYFDYQKEVPF